MIVIITAIIMVLSVLLAAFVGLAPNVGSQIEKDFMRRANNVAYLRGMEEGLLAHRTGNLAKATPQFNMDFGYLNAKGDTPTPTDKINATILLNSKNQIEVSITKTAP